MGELYTLPESDLGFGRSVCVWGCAGFGDDPRGASGAAARAEPRARVAGAVPHADRRTRGRRRVPCGLGRRRQPRGGRRAPTAQHAAGRRCPLERPEWQVRDAADCRVLRAYLHALRAFRRQTPQATHPAARAARLGRDHPAPDAPAPRRRRLRLDSNRRGAFRAVALRNALRRRRRQRA